MDCSALCETIICCEQLMSSCLCPGFVCKTSTATGTLLLFWHGLLLQTQVLLADSAMPLGGHSCAAYLGAS